jgi:hypothetical protein
MKIVWMDGVSSSAILELMIGVRNILVAVVNQLNALMLNMHLTLTYHHRYLREMPSVVLVMTAQIANYVLIQPPKTVTQ